MPLHLLPLSSSNSQGSRGLWSPYSREGSPPPSSGGRRNTLGEDRQGAPTDSPLGRGMEPQDLVTPWLESTPLQCSCGDVEALQPGAVHLSIAEALRFDVLQRAAICAYPCEGRRVGQRENPGKLKGILTAVTERSPARAGSILLRFRRVCSLRIGRGSMKRGISGPRQGQAEEDRSHP